jgi:hypothetical protein
MMAADSRGTSIETIQKATTREDLIACGASLISSEPSEEKRIEVFQVSRERGSPARALLNGLLDLSTAFLWELFATPIEIAYAKEDFYNIKVTFDSDDEIQTIELLGKFTRLNSAQ